MFMRTQVHAATFPAYAADAAAAPEGATGALSLGDLDHVVGGLARPIELPRELARAPGDAARLESGG